NPGLPPADFMLGLLEQEPEVFGHQFENFGFVPDPQDDLPIGLKRGTADPTRIHGTCALCHTGQLPDGRLWFGAPNEKLDLGRFQLEVNQRWVAAGNPSFMSAQDQERAAQLGPGRISSETDSFPKLVPDDIPVAFNLSKPTALSYLGTGHDLRS